MFNSFCYIEAVPGRTQVLVADALFVVWLVRLVTVLVFHETRLQLHTDDN